MPQDLAESSPLSVAGFCRFVGIGRTTFYQLMAERNAPATFRVGRRRLISHDAAMSWMRDQEARSTSIDELARPSEELQNVPGTARVHGSVQGLTQ